MPSGKSIESVQIEALTKQTDRLHLVVEKVAEGMAALLETTAANNVKHDDAEEFKKEAKEMFKQVAVNIKEVWTAIEKVKESIKELEKPVLRNTLVSNAVTGIAMLVLGIMIRTWMG